MCLWSVLSVLEILLILPAKLKLSRLWISRGLSVILIYSEEKYFSKRNRIVMFVLPHTIQWPRFKQHSACWQILKAGVCLFRERNRNIHGDANGICIYWRQNC